MAYIVLICGVAVTPWCSLAEAELQHSRSASVFGPAAELWALTAEGLTRCE